MAHWWYKQPDTKKIFSNTCLSITVVRKPVEFWSSEGCWWIVKWLFKHTCVEGRRSRLRRNMLYQGISQWRILSEIISNTTLSRFCGSTAYLFLSVLSIYLYKNLGKKSKLTIERKQWSCLHKSYSEGQKRKAEIPPLPFSTNHLRVTFNKRRARLTGKRLKVIL